MSTMTRPTGIKCGHCQGRHASVAEVRDCASTPKTPGEWYALNIEQAVAERNALQEHIWDAEIQRREREETERVARAKMDRDGFGHEPHTAGYEVQRSWGQEKAGRVAQDGMYRNPQTGEIFKVQWNRGSGDGRRLYAKQLSLIVWSQGEISGKTLLNIPLSGEKPEAVQHEFRYAPGAMKFIRPEWRMTIEEAKQFGALYGTCIRCGRTLTLEESIERSMGPVCAKKANWA